MKTTSYHDQEKKYIKISKATGKEREKKIIEKWNEFDYYYFIYS